MAIFHATMKVVKSDKLARAKADYITRNGKYDERQKDEILETVHLNMPDFAVKNPLQFWSLADKNERKNGVRARELEFALPIEIDENSRKQLALNIATKISQKFGHGHGLPMTYSIHNDAKNPHAHLMFSERPNRPNFDKKSFFGRGNAKSKELGGSTRKEALEAIRAIVASETNSMLEKAGRKERISHLSYARRGIDKKPGKHVGPRLYNNEEYKRLASENKKAYQTLKDANKATKDAKKLAKDDIYINQNSSLVALLFKLFKLLFDEIPKLQHAQQIREAAERAERAAYMQQQYTKKALNDYKKSMLEVTPQPEPAPKTEAKPEPKPKPVVKKMNFLNVGQKIKEEIEQPKPAPKPAPKPVEHDEDDDFGMRM